MNTVAPHRRIVRIATIAAFFLKKLSAPAFIHWPYINMCLKVTWQLLLCSKKVAVHLLHIAIGHYSTMQMRFRPTFSCADTNVIICKESACLVYSLPNVCCAATDRYILQYVPSVMEAKGAINRQTDATCTHRKNCIKWPLPVGRSFLQCHKVAFSSEVTSQVFSPCLA